MVDELIAHGARQDAERTTAGDLWHDAGLVFTTDFYAHVMPSALVDAAAAMDSLLSVPAATIDRDESGAS